MNYQINRTDSFVKTARKFLKKHPDLKERFKAAILKLAEDPFATSLKTHKLKGDLKDRYGLSLTYQYRITLTIQIKEKDIFLLDIGSHDEVY